MKIYKSIFSEEVLRRIYLVSRDKKQPARTNFFDYQSSIIGFSNAVFSFDCDDELKEKIADELLAKEILPKRPKVWACFVHLFSRNSFIPWHDDSKYKMSGTVYLNTQWDKDMGGGFLYEEGDEIKAVFPEFNKGGFFVPPMMHTTTITAINAPMRESLQIFITEFE